MSDPHPPTRRDLMRPAQLLGLAFIAAIFAGIVTAVSMGVFQDRFTGESVHALIVGLIVAGITFIVTAVVIALLLLAVQPSDVVHRIDAPVLIARDEAVAAEKAAKAAKAAREARTGSAASSTDAAGDRPADAPGDAGKGDAPV